MDSQSVFAGQDILERTSEPQVYLRHQQVPDGGLVFYAPKELVIRSTGDMEPLLAAVRETFQRADSELPIPKARTLADVVSAESSE